MRIIPIACLMMVIITSVNADNSIIVNSETQQTAIVELYTSEGCSSCPPADRWFSEVAESKTELNILPLAFHVDYWDYIGWKDRFANPQYTQRQRMLARHNHMKTIYTPGFFVNGKEARGTNNILDQIQSSTQQSALIDLTLKVQRKIQDIQLTLDHQMQKPITNSPLYVQFIVYENQLSSEVTRGENAGRQLDHQHVVRYLSDQVKLGPSVQHLITPEKDWNVLNVGIAAWVKTGNGDIIQAIQTPILSLYSES